MGEIIYLFNEKGGKDMATICDLAQTFLSFESMSHKKLQKLCFYAQALHLALNNEPLVNCEFQAWIHGPVCPELYAKYREWGFRNIPKSEIPNNIKENSYLTEFIKTIYDAFGYMSADKLEELTHSEDPWIIARGNLEDWKNSSNVIDNRSMEEYYKIYLEE